MHKSRNRDIRYCFDASPWISNVHVGRQALILIASLPPLFKPAIADRSFWHFLDTSFVCTAQMSPTDRESERLGQWEKISISRIARETKYFSFITALIFFSEISVCGRVDFSPNKTVLTSRRSKRERVDLADFYGRRSFVLMNSLRCLLCVHRHRYRHDFFVFVSVKNSSHWYSDGCTQECRPGQMFRFLETNVRMILTTWEKKVVNDAWVFSSCQTTIEEDLQKWN